MGAASTRLGRGSALLLVDIQRDFCAGGALAVPDGDAVVPAANRWIDRASAEHVPVITSRDWHPAYHVSFRERGGPWPPHCVQGSPGAEFHPNLRVPADALVVSKGIEPSHDAYSDFDGTGLAERLRALGIDRLYIGGLALEYCVRATVLDALAAGFEVRLLLDATRALGVRPGDAEAALREMTGAGAAVVETAAP
jgi:nicotinamidase/pyrazinamidase